MSGVVAVIARVSTQGLQSGTKKARVSLVGTAGEAAQLRVQGWSSPIHLGLPPYLKRFTPRGWTLNSQR